MRMHANAPAAIVLLLSLAWVILCQQLKRQINDGRDNARRAPREGRSHLALLKEAAMVCLI